MLMDISQEILSDIIVHMKDAKFESKEFRRETWSEICDRNMQMHIKKYPQLKSEITHCYNDYVVTKKILTSMRSMQIAGKPIEVSTHRVYHCAKRTIDAMESFWEDMYL